MNGTDAVAHWKQIDQQNIGKRVELSPSTDAWMQGDRYGEIVRTTVRLSGNNTLDPRDAYPVFVAVRLDSGRTIRVHESLVTIVDETDDQREYRMRMGL